MNNKQNRYFYDKNELNTYFFKKMPGVRSNATKLIRTTILTS